MKDLLTIENGTRSAHTFSAAEYGRRRDALFVLMEENGMDAALFTSVHNINYYTDFLYCSFGRAYGLVVKDGKLTTISANIDGGQPWRRTVGDNVVYSDWQRGQLLLVRHYVCCRRAALSAWRWNHMDRGYYAKTAGGVTGL